MMLAVFKGVALGIRDLMDVARKLGVKISRSMICGGGAKSALWKKIFANVLNIDINTAKTEEGSGYSGSILAGVNYNV